ncbi:hypothetical protein JTB14_019765 [Gonioctena quinquepunctata]|nr:hypothetical protein JTB14_019765 [Gonioctena quinquepunctata]
MDVRNDSNQVTTSSTTFKQTYNDVERKVRLDERKIKLSQNEPQCYADIDFDNDEPGDAQETGISTQTDLTLEELALKFEQLSVASQIITELNLKLENSPFGLMDQQSDNSKWNKYYTRKWKYYTGFEYEFVNSVIFIMVKTYIPSTITTALSPFNQLLLTLIKLRLDLHFKDLAYHFKIAPTTASKYFEIVVGILYKRLKPCIRWPDRSVSRMNIPSCFKESYHDKTTVILNCFEIFIEKPASLLSRQQSWSNYKHHNTIKILVGISPQGSICYISDTWCGRAFDKQIVERSNFCDNIKPGDIVLADRGFLIHDTLGILQAKLIMPAFTKHKNQLHPIEIEETRQIAHVRIHIERVIGLIKNKFGIFHGTIPISMIKKGTETVSLLDKIVTVCSGLVNISEPIIPL